MGADPEPRDRVVLYKSQRPPPQADANRIQAFVAVNSLEMQTRMCWIVALDLVAPPGLFLDSLGQFGKASQKV